MLKVIQGSKVLSRVAIPKTTAFAASNSHLFAKSNFSTNSTQVHLIQSSSLRSIKNVRHFSSNVPETPLNLDDIETVTKHYEESHMPLGFKRKLGEPYTNTRALENLPEAAYNGHMVASGIRDHIALGLVRFARIFTHLFFKEKYGHHAVVLETVAAVPGMVAGMHRHFRALRKMKADMGWIEKLLEEAENERMHLMTWMKVIEPTKLERLLVVLAQFIYTPFYAALYVLSPYTAHRFVGYLEEEAVHEYTNFLNAIDKGDIENVPAPDVAKEYWNLHPDARIRDVVLVIRADECMHRNVNHVFSNKVLAKN